MNRPPARAAPALHAAMKGDYIHSTFGVIDDELFWHEENSPSSSDPVFRRPLADLSKPLNLTEWNRFELRFRGARMSAVVNGEVVQEASRPPARDRGSIGMRVQNAKVEVRRIDVIPR